MKIGLVGYSGSGKSTIFNALTGLSVATGTYGGGRVTLGTIRIPDARLDKLEELYESKKKTHAEILCTDIPGRVGSEQGLDSITLENIRDANALALVVKAFDGRGNPASDVSKFASELIMADLMLVEGRLERIKRQKDKSEQKILGKLADHLGEERPLLTLELDDSDRTALRGYAFVSNKPVIVVLNVDEDAVESGQYDDTKNDLTEQGYATFVLCGRLEEELGGLEPEEQVEFLEGLGLTETGRARFIRAAYQALDLITFLTAGEKEVRCWPIPRGINAKRAAGKIHSDLERGFIRSEVFHFDDLVEHGSEAALKSIGKLRVEGKGYIVKDGDVMLIRHSS